VQNQPDATTSTTKALTPTTMTTVPPGEPALILAAGDITDCNRISDSATAAIAAGFPDATILTLGDNVYPGGTAADYNDCWVPAWGSLDPQIRPSPGNHDYYVAGATDYFDYFGAAAGIYRRGYYSFDLDEWHIISLNTDIATGTSSDQYEWLQLDLADNSAECTIAYWHTPRYTTGSHQPGSSASQDFWSLLDQAGAEVILNGHEHSYQRFEPLDGDGNPDANGIRQFVVGTGGTSLSPQEIEDSRLVVYSATHGLLKLDLKSGSYAWEFLPIAGSNFTDSGNGTCH
jgi:hypothetical protein